MAGASILAVFNVWVAVTLGILPIIWGMVLDALAHSHVMFGVWKSNSYSFMYVCLAATLLVSLPFLNRLPQDRPRIDADFLAEHPAAKQLDAGAEVNS